MARAGLHPPAGSHATSSLNQEGGWRLVALVSVAGNDLHDGNVGPRDEANQPHQADDEVLDFHRQRQALAVENDELQQGWKDERQEAAADRAHQRDDEVQLWDQDGEGTWDTRGGKKDTVNNIIFKVERGLKHF